MRAQILLINDDILYTKQRQKNINVLLAFGAWNSSANTGRFIIFSVITNIYNRKTKGPTLMEFFTATGKLKKFFFYN
jgi:hypothetical protein